jgi:hypothetical protein
MKSLTGMGGMGGARELAEMLRQMGRGGDTVLAHITPEEAQMLMDAGGSGDTNPNTGLPEFQPYGDADIQGDEDFYGRFAGAYQTGGDVQAQEGGFYGNTPDAIYNTGTKMTYSGRLPGRVPIAGPYTSDELEPFRRSNVEAQMAREGTLDIGFGPGRFAPEYTPQDVSGMAPDQFQRMQAGVEPSFLQSAAQNIEGVGQQAKDLARQYPNIAGLLRTGATTLPAIINASRMRRETERQAAELQKLGAPLRAQGEALRQQALAGGLTPQQASQQEAARARLRQTAATRGTTTGTQEGMIENQLARTRSQLAETNLNNAIKQLNLANAYDEQAIKLKLAAEQDIADIYGRIVSGLGRNIGSEEGQGQGQQPPAPQTRLNLPPATQRPQVRES